ncbi:hypothetical protein D2V93_03695 [Flagellimonas taeanensis]|uniref:hypothetical protein n=1 Tax=Flavobacteriaceae TaxID=49546 RepID=UPI000E6A7D87|nr:hypothetical protein [Muricauda sp. SK9]MDC6385222.1 hypothetical protein [Muricauda sp. SK9]RIV52700.1 hypothetical protein D2V93_03695 [Allomuricauda taeanensis]
MKTLLFLPALFFLVHLHGQKLVKKAFIGPRTESIQIDAQYCYRIDLATSPTDEVQVSASIEGEYAKDLLVSIEEEGTTVLVSAGFQPIFINPNDKLSAHKVVSIALQISVPEYKKVSVYGTNSNVNAMGKYENLHITLSDGICTLENVSETVEVATQKGDIWLTAPSGDILAESTYGKVDQETIPFGDNQFILKTVEGQIHLKKTK